MYTNSNLSVKECKYVIYKNINVLPANYFMREKDFSHLWISDVVIAFIVNNLKTKKIYLELANNIDIFDFPILRLMSKVVNIAGIP